VEIIVAALITAAGSVVAALIGRRGQGFEGKEGPGEAR
jgi:hypothetical protein